MDLSDKKLEELLERFWEGQTTLEEEKQLKQYFRNRGEETESAAYFHWVEASAEVRMPGRSKPRPLWPRYLLSAAAVSAGLLCIAIFLFQQNTPQSAQSAARLAPPEKPSAQTTPALVPSPKPDPAPDTHAAAPPKRKVKPAVPREAQEAEQAEQAIQDIKAALALVSSKIKKGQTEAARGLKEVEHVDIIKKHPAEG